MNRKQKTYHAWLHNAYGQEICMARMYRMHANDVSRGLNDFPKLKEKLLEQSAVCLSQAARLQPHLLRVTGRKPFWPKVWLGNAMGIFLGWTGDVTIDKVIMNNLTDYGMICFEVAAYKTLFAAAQEMKDAETARVCHEILVEEEAFAHWLETRVHTYGQSFLKRVDEGK